MEKYKKYNELQKDRFLSSIGLDQFPPLYWERLFDKTSILENIRNKDICDFTIQEIIELYKFLDSKSFDTLWLYNNNLKIYTSWCIENTLVKDGMSHFNEITDELIKSCVNVTYLKNSILTKDEILGITRQLNLREAFAIMAFFEGIKGEQFKEVIYLKASDINKEKQTATLITGRTIPVSKEFVNLAINANEETTYTTKGRTYTFESSLYIYKNTYTKARKEDDVVKKQRIYKSLKINLEAIGYTGITSTDLVNAGAINMINGFCEKYNYTAEQVMYDKELFELIRNKYQLDPNLKRRFLLKYEQFLA